MFSKSIFGRQSHGLIPANGVFLADAGYKLYSHVLTPYSIHAGMDKDESHYNYLHSKTRIVVERAFGAWKNKFRVFEAPLRWQDTRDLASLVTSTMILHNWLIDLDDEEGVELAPWMLIGNVAPPLNQYAISGDDALEVRDLVKEYLANNITI
jgi:hypothetical protein